MQATDGGVGFSGPFELCYRANLESRIASRVLWRVGSDHYRREEDIYKAAYALPWQDWFDSTRTIMVKVSAKRCPLQSLDFITLKNQGCGLRQVPRPDRRAPEHRYP